MAATLPPGSSTIDVFRPLLEAARGVDLADPAAAEAELTRRFPPQGRAARALNAELVRLLRAGKIAERGELPVRWGRVAKASAETDDLSIDVVHMTGAGPRHLHPSGEIDYCVALEQQPSFDGREPGWVVLAPGSEHVPTVSGGAMLVVYLLPGGKIEFR
jgi:hypothetical protein